MFALKTEKPTLTIWTDNSFKKNFLFLIQKEVQSLPNFISRFRDGYFLEPLSIYYKFKFKDLGDAEVNKNEINWLVYPCDCTTTLKFLIKNISNETYKFCEENDFKIIISYYREYLSTSEIEDLEKYILNFFINENKSSKVIKILVNGFTPKVESKYPEYFVSINFMDKLTRVFIDKKKFIKKQHPYAENRKYDFSVLIGKLDDRIDRILFFTDCYVRGLIDERFFYTIICLNRDEVYSNIIRNVYMQPNYIKENVRKTIDDLLENRIFDDKGNRLTLDQHIYHQQHEYKIPIQMLDSYVNIVLETRPFSPSLTEKIYKPIVSGVPFIWHGSLNILQFLESEGYKPYPFIDYSFDRHPSKNRRREMLIEEMQRLKKLNLKEEVKKCKDIARHNILNFYKVTNNFDNLLDLIYERI